MATWNGTTGYTDAQKTQLDKVTDDRKAEDTPSALIDPVSIWNEDSYKAKLKTYSAGELKALINIKSYSSGYSDATATIVYDSDANDYSTQEQTWIAGFCVKTSWIQKVPQMLVVAERLKALSYSDQLIIDILREF